MQWGLGPSCVHNRTGIAGTTAPSPGRAPRTTTSQYTTAALSPRACRAQRGRRMALTVDLPAHVTLAAAVTRQTMTAAAVPQQQNTVHPSFRSQPSSTGVRRRRAANVASMARDLLGTVLALPLRNVSAPRQHRSHTRLPFAERTRARPSLLACWSSHIASPCTNYPFPGNA